MSASKVEEMRYSEMFLGKTAIYLYLCTVFTIEILSTAYTYI